MKKVLGREIAAEKKPAFIHNDQFDFSPFDRQFDYFLAQSILSHTSQTQMRMLFRSAAKCMHASSIFLATYNKGSRDYTGDSWVYPGDCAFRAETVSACADAFGLGMDEVNWPHPAGQSWACLYPRPSVASARARLGLLVSAGERGEWQRAHPA